MFTSELLTTSTSDSCLVSYRISIAILVSFVSRALSTIPGDLFCYNAISAAGVVLILPGFTIRACFRGHAAKLLQSAL